MGCIPMSSKYAIGFRSEKSTGNHPGQNFDNKEVGTQRKELRPLA
jgi:hypothetical protein